MLHKLMAKKTIDLFYRNMVTMNILGFVIFLCPVYVAEEAFFFGDVR